MDPTSNGTVRVTPRSRVTFDQNKIVVQGEQPQSTSDTLVVPQYPDNADRRRIQERREATDESCPRPTPV